MKTNVNHQTQDRIIEAAGDVFSQKGYHDANVDEIVRLAETSKGGIYFHFPSKEILFFAVMDGLASQLVNKVERAVSREKTPQAKCEVALETVLITLGEHKKLARLLLVQGYSMGKAFENKRSEIFSRFAGQIESVLEQAVKKGDIPELDSKLASYVWLGAISEVTMRWLQSPAAPSPKEAYPHMRDMLLRSAGFKVSTSRNG